MLGERLPRVPSAYSGFHHGATRLRPFGTFCASASSSAAADGSFYWTTWRRFARHRRIPPRQSPQATRRDEIFDSDLVHATQHPDSSLFRSGYATLRRDKRFDISIFRHFDVSFPPLPVSKSPPLSVAPSLRPSIPLSTCQYQPRYPLVISSSLRVGCAFL